MKTAKTLEITDAMAVEIAEFYVRDQSKYKWASNIKQAIDYITIGVDNMKAAWEREDITSAWKETMLLRFFVSDVVMISKGTIWSGTFDMSDLILNQTINSLEYASELIKAQTKGPYAEEDYEKHMSLRWHGFAEGIQRLEWNIERMRENVRDVEEGASGHAGT